MAFVVPGKHQKNPPKPQDPRQEIVEMEEGIFAAICCRGAQNQKRARRHQDQLEQWILEKGRKIQGLPMVAFYNAPFTPSFMKRNEVLMRDSGMDAAMATGMTPLHCRSTEETLRPDRSVGQKGSWYQQNEG